MTKRRQDRTPSNLKIAHEELQEQFDELRNINDSVFSVNSALNGIIASCEKHEGRLKQIADVFKKEYQLPEVTFKGKQGLIEEFESISNYCREIIQNTSISKVDDPYALKNLMKISKLFEETVDISKIFFILKNLHQQTITTPAIQYITECSDPLEFTQLIKITPNFLKSNPTSFNKECALQEVHTKLVDLVEKLSEAHDALVAKNDEIKMFLQYPSVEILQKSVQFQRYISFHRKSRESFTKTSSSYAKQANQILIMLGQIKNNLHGTSQYFTKSINEIKAESAAIQEKYVNSTIKLAELRSIKFIKDKYSTNAITKYINSNKMYTDAENKLIEGVCDTDKLRAFHDYLVQSKDEAASNNKEFRDLLNKLDSGALVTANSETEDSRKLRQAIDILFDQVSDGFSAFISTFEIASQMSGDVEECVRAMSTIGKMYEDVDVIESQVACKPSNNWYEQLTRRTSQNIDKKKTDLEQIQKETKDLKSATSKLKSSVVGLKTDKEHKCEQCRINRTLCLATCGHTFCENCLKREKCHGKCPICMKLFREADVIKIMWE